MAPLNFNAKVLTEPLLEFGDGGKDIDPRRGLVDYGPLQPMPGDKVRIGVIGTADTTDGFAQFIERCSTGLDGRARSSRTSIRHFPVSETEIRSAAHLKSIRRPDGSCRRRTSAGLSRSPSSPTP